MMNVFQYDASPLLNLKVVLPRYQHHSPDYTSPDGSRYVTWDTSPVQPPIGLRTVGIEPINLLLFRSFEET